jgi:hypothetical protein
VTGKESSRYARYAEAVGTIVGYPSETMVNAVMAAADAELQERKRSDPLLGRIVVCTDPDTGAIVAAGKVTGVNRAGGGMELTVVQYSPPEEP